MHGSNAFRRRLLLSVLAASAPAARSQTESSDRTESGIVRTVSDLYRFERFELDSTDGLRHYQVQVAVPRAVAPFAGFPVAYLLDGNAAFAALTQERLHPLEGKPLVMVGIGYRNGRPFDVEARAFDYTPPVPKLSDEHNVDAAFGRATGGAERMLDLIETRIKPGVQARAAIDLHRQALWGHSYGGLFTLYTLLMRPDAFRTYAAADPSLWWGDGALLKIETEARPLPEEPPRRLLVMTGGASGRDDAPPRRDTDAARVARMRAARRSVPPDAAEAFVQRQARRPGIEARLQVFDGLGHGPMLAASLGPSLVLAAGTGAP